MLVADRPFKEFWSKKIHPAMQGDLERLLKTMPKRTADKHKQKLEKEKKKHEDDEELSLIHI